MERAERRLTWLQFAREYVEMKWPHLAPNSRRNSARALTNATLALLASDRGRPPEAELRKALTASAFNVRSRGAKQPDDVAGVPCAPELTALLHQHVEGFGTEPDGRLFWGVRGGELAESTYCRVWCKARVAALTPDEAASPLTSRPYDL